MKKTYVLLSILSLIVIGYSCKKNVSKSAGTVELELPSTPYTYSAMSFNSDPTINNKATLGRVLFYDSHLSINNAISCASCHKQAYGFADNVAFSVGYEGRLTYRNSKNIANLEGNDNSGVIPPFTTLSSNQGLPLFWDGRENILTNLVARPITNHVEMGFVDFNTLPQKLSSLSYYSSLFSDAYGDNNITSDRISECVADFLASITSSGSKVDQFIASGAQTGLSSLEYAGYTLFTSKYNCDNCHHVFSSSYTVLDFKDIGLDATYTDIGRGTITGNDTDKGKFKVPSLHNVALTAPYMHDGRYKTLGDVIDHYSHGIQSSKNLDQQFRNADGTAKQMNIPDADKEALIAFLNAFTDYNMVTDPKFSNPFKLN